MTGWLVDLLINEFIHHNFEVMAVFRFHQDYVNLLFFLIFYTMLQNLHLGRHLNFAVISCFRSALWTVVCFCNLLQLFSHFSQYMMLN